MEMIVGGGGTYPESELKLSALEAGSADRASIRESRSPPRMEPSEFKKLQTDRQSQFYKKGIYTSLT
jgi:hypothetical protein